jgi:GNAT superfamily N-acetyltransferase
MEFLSKLLLLFVFIPQAADSLEKKKDSYEYIDLYDVVSFSREHGMTGSLEKVEALIGKIELRYVPAHFFSSRKILALKEGVEAGCVKMKKGEIRDLVVESEFRRQGVARALVLASFFKLAALSKENIVTISWLPVTFGVISQEELEEFYLSFYGVIGKVDSYGIMFMSREFCKP